MPDGPFRSGPVDIQGYLYSQGDLNSGVSPSSGRPPVIHAGQQLTFKNLDDSATPSTWHTITACQSPCNRDTGIAYPIADGSRQFDSGQLGNQRAVRRAGHRKDHLEDAQEPEAGHLHILLPRPPVHARQLPRQTLEPVPGHVLSAATPVSLRCSHGGPRGR